VFPEIEADKVEFTQGMNVTLVTNAGNDERARRLLQLLGMPFREK
jgi:large subunit ribosomal protein L5